MNDCDGMSQMFPRAARIMIISERWSQHCYGLQCIAFLNTFDNDSIDNLLSKEMSYQIRTTTHNLSKTIDEVREEELVLSSGLNSLKPFGNVFKRKRP